MSITDPTNENAWDRGISSISAHSTPDPDAEPPGPNPNPDDVPPPAHAPVQEPTTTPEPPIKARPGWMGSGVTADAARLACCRRMGQG